MLQKSLWYLWVFTKICWYMNRFVLIYVHSPSFDVKASLQKNESGSGRIEYTAAVMTTAKCLATVISYNCRHILNPNAADFQFCCSAYTTPFLVICFRALTRACWIVYGECAHLLQFYLRPLLLFMLHVMYASLSWFVVWLGFDLCPPSILYFLFYLCFI
jgi:hypothetical protein